MSKKIFVTGGAGFVGSHTVLLLLEKGYDVVILDNCSNSVRATGTCKPESVVRLEAMSGKSISYYDADLKDKSALKEIFEQHKFDCVIHFAAMKAVGESVEKPLEYYSNNVCGTVNLLEVMREFNVYCLIYSSSCTVYGEPKYLPLDEVHPTGQGCTNPYGKSKVFTEEIMKDIATTDKRWKIILLRYFNPVGAHHSGKIGEDPKGIPNNLLPYVSQVAVGKLKCLRVFGNDYDTADGTGIRDYLHVMDCGEGHVKAFEFLSQPDFTGCKPFNLGTGRGSSVLEVVEAFEKATGKKVPYEITERRPGDLAKVWASCDTSKEELKWTANFTLEDACRDMWTWQTQNPNGFAK